MPRPSISTVKKSLKNALIGGALGIAAPISLAFINEVSYGFSKAGNLSTAKICIAERHWYFSPPRARHAKGCKNKILDSIPLWIITGIAGGLAFSAISGRNKKFSSNFEKYTLQNQNNNATNSDANNSAVAVPQSTPEAKVESFQKEEIEKTPAPSTTSKPQDISPNIRPIKISPDLVQKIQKQFQNQVNNLDAVQWKTIGKGAAIAGIGIFALIAIKQASTPKVQRQVTVLESVSTQICVDLFGYRSNCMPWSLNRTTNPYNACLASPDLNAISKSDFTELLSKGAVIIGSPTNLEKLITRVTVNGSNNYSTNCNIRKYIMEGNAAIFN